MATEPVTPFSIIEGALRRAATAKFGSPADIVLLDLALAGFVIQHPEGCSCKACVGP
jgi:hypothetical protein